MEVGKSNKETECTERGTVRGEGEISLTLKKKISH